MKIMFYFLRPFDELAYCEKFSSEFGIAFDHCDDYPDESNIRLARGCEAVSVTPCDLGAKVLDRFHEVASAISAAGPSATTTWISPARGSSA